jgi:hypothetical protein
VGDFFSNLTPQRIIIFVVCVGIIVFYVRYKWGRASKYVDDRNKLYSEHYSKMEEYAARVRTDPRWPRFIEHMQSRYRVVDTDEPPDDETFVVHYCSIWDETGRQYEPGEDTSGVTSMSAFLKRRIKPKYIRFQMSPGGDVTEEKIGGMTWYDMFEKSV